MCHTFSEALQNRAASALFYLYKYERFNSQEKEKTESYDCSSFRFTGFVVSLFNQLTHLITELWYPTELQVISEITSITNKHCLKGGVPASLVLPCFWKAPQVFLDYHTVHKSVNI